MAKSLRTSMSWSRESMIPRRHSTEEHLVDGRHRSSSRSRGHGLIAADGHRCSSNHIDQEQENIINNNDDYDPAVHHEYYYCHCQYQPANNNINEAVPDELDFRDVFGGPPRSTTNILLRRCGFSGALGTTTTASAGGTRSLTNFYDEIFCPVLRASHLHHDYHQSDPDPNSRHEDPGGRSVLGDGCFLHSRAKMRNNSRKPDRIGRNLPGFDIPSSSFSFSLAEEEKRRTSEEKEAEFLMKTEDGFYDDIFRSSSNGNGSGGDRRLMRSSRTCNCMLPKSAKSRSKSKSKASAGSSTSVLGSDQDVHVTSPPSHVIRSSIHNENNMTRSPASAARRHHGRRKEEEDAIFSSFASKLRPITIPSKSTCRSSRGYDSSPAPSTILSAEEDVNERCCSQRTSLVTINPQSATTFMDLCSTSSSPPLPPSSSDHHVKKSSVNSNLFQHDHCWYHVQPNSSTTTESTTPAILFSGGLTKSRPNRSSSASVSGGRSASTTANGSVGDNICDYAPRSPSSVISSVFLEPLATNAAQTAAHEKRITEKKELVAQEGDHEIGACESDQNDSVSLFIKDIEYINCRSRTHAMGDTEGAAAVDEAIAWAKEKFWNG